MSISGVLERPQVSLNNNSFIRVSQQSTHGFNAQASIHTIAGYPVYPGKLY
jgi:hypothetical protein